VSSKYDDLNMTCCIVINYVVYLLIVMGDKRDHSIRNEEKIIDALKAFYLLSFLMHDLFDLVESLPCQIVFHAKPKSNLKRD